MSNSNGNQYAFWYIDSNFQVFAVDGQNKSHSKSNENFASSLAVSVDGTVWAISREPDPDGGGARIYWSTGDGSWNEISTSDPGGVKIAGGEGSSCYYITEDGVVRTLDTNGTSNAFSDLHSVLAFDYGGGHYWAIYPNERGGIATLHYSTDGVTWNDFAGKPEPIDISVGYQGNCYAVDDSFNPVYYSNDGSSTGSASAGADGKALQISFKNWSYLVSSAISDQENVIMRWVDTQGGMYQNSGFTGCKVFATYNRR